MSVLLPCRAHEVWIPYQNRYGTDFDTAVHAHPFTTACARSTEADRALTWKDTNISWAAQSCSEYIHFHYVWSCQTDARPNRQVIQTTKALVVSEPTEASSSQRFTIEVRQKINKAWTIVQGQLEPHTCGRNPMLNSMPKYHDLLRMKLFLLGSFTGQTDVHQVPATKRIWPSQTNARLILNCQTYLYTGDTNRSEDWSMD